MQFRSLAHNSHIAAIKKIELVMNNIEEIFYCSVGNCGWSTHKEYAVVERKNWKYIVVDGKQIGVAKLPEKIRIRNFDDFVFSYVFGGIFSNLPCLAMDYFVYRKITGKKIPIRAYLDFINLKK